MKNICFLLYDNRSGSTLLSSLLHQYKYISVSQESIYVPRLIEYYNYRCNNKKKEIDKILDYLYKEKKFSYLPFTRKELALKLFNLKAPFDKKEVIETIIKLYFNKIDKTAEFFILKQPVFLYIDKIIELFPSAKFIHIIRDGRAVYNSKITSVSPTTKKSMDNNLFHAAKNWRFVLKMTEKYSDLVFNIKYENLIKDEESELLKVLDYLEVPSEKRIKTKNKTDYFNIINKSERHLHWNILKNSDKDIAMRWEKNLKAVEIYLYEKVNGDFLKKYNYPLLYSRKKTNLLFKLKVLGFALYLLVKRIISKARNLIYYMFKRDISINEIFKMKWKKFWIQL